MDCGLRLIFVERERDEGGLVLIERVARLSLSSLFWIGYLFLWGCFCGEGREEGITTGFY